jgi:hypothetical protein
LQHSNFQFRQRGQLDRVGGAHTGTSAMRAKTLQIVWHCKEPVFSLDFSPCEPCTLITAGADKDIKVRCYNVTLRTLAHGLTLHRLGHDAIAVCLDVRSLHVRACLWTSRRNLRTHAAAVGGAWCGADTSQVCCGSCGFLLCQRVVMLHSICSPHRHICWPRRCSMTQKLMRTSAMWAALRG